MSNNRDLLKEAIADAKAVKETAIANAKAALEEAFTPHLKSMLAAKLEEMDKEDDVKEEIENVEEVEVSEEVEAVEENEEVTEAEEVEEAKKEEVEEEINLDELLAELEEGEELEEVKESEEIEESEEVTEEEEVEAEEGEDEEAEGEMEEEEVDLEDMTEDDLKSFIEDVIKDMVEAGELEAGEEMEMDDEESEMDMDIEVEDEEEEIMEDDAVSKKLKDGASLDSAPRKVGQSTVQEGEEIEESALGVAAIMAGMGIVGGAAEALKRYLDKNPKAKEKFLSATGAALAGSGKAGMAETEALNEIGELKQELQEVNLLNAKLLYTNKIFKTKNLSEDKKVKVLKAFDKATTVKEAKVIFETLNEGMTSKKSTSSINEVKGSASKATGIAPKAKQPIVENDAFARMQRLAGIIKEN